jgi:SAM-dependent methyltransferase
MITDLDWARGLNDSDWCAFLAGELNIPGRSPPPLPSPEFQRSWVGSAGLIAFTEAMAFLRRMKAGMAEAGSPLRRDMRVLDFGVGWGRFYRLLTRDVDQLVGADPDLPCIKMCQDMLRGGEFVQIPTRPVYEFLDDEFDLIYAYSVFTHLAEPIFIEVLHEFSRMVKPGGFIAFTTLPLSFIDILRTDAHSYGIEKTDFDPALWRARAAAGEFLFVPTGGGGSAETPDIYGWALIARPYLERALRGTPFTLLAMESGLPQEFVLIRSMPKNARKIQAQFGSEMVPSGSGEPIDF